MIFERYKPYEFRNKILNGMDTSYPIEDIKAYIYETKNKGGTGKVVGDVKILGSYSLHYGDLKYSDTELVKERFYCIKTLYVHWCELKGIKPNMNEGWFKSKKFLRYKKEIGFFNTDDSLTCNYALILDTPIQYECPRSLSDFSNANGMILNRPPQNMFRVSCNHYQI